MSGVRITRAAVILYCHHRHDIKPGTARQWLARGHFTAHPDGYDPDEIDHWIVTIRHVDKARGAVLATHSRHQTRPGTTEVA